MSSIDKAIKNMYYLYCYDCDSRHEMTYDIDDNTYLCPECYREIEQKFISDDDKEFNMCKMRKYIMDNPTIAKKIIIKYLLHIEYPTNLLYDKNKINEYYDDLLLDKFNYYDYKLFSFKFQYL